MAAAMGRADVSGGREDRRASPRRSGRARLWEARAALGARASSEDASASAGASCAPSAPPGRGGATLPIREVLRRCLDELREGSLVLQAPPGRVRPPPCPWDKQSPRVAGDDGVIVVLEPRRLAARAAATRMAEILGEPVGKTVGYRVRFDSKISRDTRIEVVTEGVLARRLQRDPGLEKVKAVVFDEFHERSLDADLCLALATDVRAALRPDLRLVVMSATLGQVGPAAADLLGSSELPDAALSTKEDSTKRAPIVASEGRAFPVRTEYLGAPGRGRHDLADAVASAVARALDEHPGPDGGDVLVFLPGAREINDAVAATRRNEPRVKPELVLPLHGGLSRVDQAAALAPAPAGQRRVVVSTPIAESSLTIPGVRLVVDSGLRKTPRFDAGKGMTRLDVTRVSVASADQRRGRAGRVAPGVCYRLWSETTHASLAADTPPEIASADLAPLALNLAAWGAALADPAAALPWLDPPAGQMAAARAYWTPRRGRGGHGAGHGDGQGDGAPAGAPAHRAYAAGRARAGRKARGWRASWRRCSASATCSRPRAVDVRARVARALGRRGREERRASAGGFPGGIRTRAFRRDVPAPARPRPRRHARAHRHEGPERQRSKKMAGARARRRGRRRARRREERHQRRRRRGVSFLRVRRRRRGPRGDEGGQGCGGAAPAGAGRPGEKRRGRRRRAEGVSRVREGRGLRRPRRAGVSLSARRGRGRVRRAAGHGVPRPRRRQALARRARAQAVQRERRGDRARDGPAAAAGRWPSPTRRRRRRRVRRRERRCFPRNDRARRRDRPCRGAEPGGCL